MENKESGNLNTNGQEHKAEENEVIAEATSGEEQFSEIIGKASESFAETSAHTIIPEEGPEQDESENADESGKIIEAEKNVETSGEAVMNSVYPPQSLSLPELENIYEEPDDISTGEKEEIIQGTSDFTVVAVDKLEGNAEVEQEIKSAGASETPAGERINEENPASRGIVETMQADENGHVTSAVEEAAAEEKQHEMILNQIDAHVDDDNAESLENYDVMGKDVLLDKFALVVEQEDAVSNKNKAFAIRDAFNKVLAQERNEALAKFIEEGGNKDDFDKSKNTTEEKFAALFEKYKKKRSQQIEAVEQQKLNNLHNKQEILNHLKNLIQNEENMQKAYTEFNELQNKWRTIGAVPAANVRDLLLNYKLYVDRFYDFVKINRELQALDQKKNLLLKINLCERAEQLMLENSINRAVGQINNLMYEWREVGPVPRDKKDELWQRFKAAVDKVFERRREHDDSLKDQHDENLKRKQELVAKLEQITNIVHDKHVKWQETLKEVMQITADYKKIGHASRKENEEVWTRFKNLCDNFFKNKNEFYQLRKKDNAANIQLKTELCIQAEGLKESTDWKTTSQEMIRLQDEWKKIGHVYDKQNQKLWQRFKNACDEFFNRKTNHFSSIDKEYEDNFIQKLALVDQIEKFEMETDNQNNLDQMREFQRQWTEIGLVPIKKKDEVQKRYRAAIDKLYNSLNLDEREKSRLRFTHKGDDIRSSGSGNRSYNKSGTGKNETGVIASKITALSNEVTIWQNNIGFFSKSKNAELIRNEFENKINKAKEEILMLKQKLKELKEQ